MSIALVLIAAVTQVGNQSGDGVADAANKNLGDLAHELNNLIGVVIGNLDLLKRSL